MFVSHDRWFLESVANGVPGSTAAVVAMTVAAIRTWRHLKAGSSAERAG